MVSLDIGLRKTTDPDSFFTIKSARSVLSGIDMAISIDVPEKCAGPVTLANFPIHSVNCKSSEDPKWVLIVSR